MAALTAQMRPHGLAHSSPRGSRRRAFATECRSYGGAPENARSGRPAGKPGERSRAARPKPYCNGNGLPPMTVPSTLMAFSSSGDATVSGLRSRMVKSASFPASIEPFLSSWPSR
jgi:hypothetical protein